MNIVSLASKLPLLLKCTMKSQSLSAKTFVCAVVTTPRERHRPLSISIIADSSIVRFVLERHSPFQFSTTLNTDSALSMKPEHLV